MQDKVAAKPNFKATGKKDKVKNKKNPVEAASPAQNNQKKKAAMKRKPEKAGKQNGDVAQKKMKLAFPGTGGLDNKKKVGSDGKSEDGMNRAQRRRLRNKQKRMMSKTSLSQLIEKLQKGDADTITMIKDKITAIKSRDSLSTSARKKLKRFENILKLGGVTVEGSTESKSPVQGKKNQKKNKKEQQQKKSPNKKAAAKKEESDEEASPENGDGESDDENDSNEHLELEAEESDDEEGSDEEEEDDDEEDDDEKDDDEDDEEEKTTPQKQAKQQKNKQNDSQQKGKSRYVVFVGNLPYDIEKDQIKEHFNKVGEIQDVRIAIDPQTKKSRGFAYVEVKNEEAYQKALTLHNTFINGRKINVQYTQGGKKKGEDAKKEIKAKNMKLQAMRKGGKLGGSPNPAQKRAQRRMKQGAN